MVLELVSETDVKFSKRKDHIRCKLCGANNTRSLSNGDPIWVKDKNNKRHWTGQYICYDCYYTTRKICHKCGMGEITKSCRIYRYYDGETWMGKYICNDCYRKEFGYNKNRNIDIGIMLKIGEGGESIMDLVVSQVLEVPTYSIYIGDMRLPFNIVHEYYGIVGIKTSIIKYGDVWHFNINERISADSYFCIGLDKNLKNIEIVYIFPIKNRKQRGQIDIYKNNSSKYKEFVTDRTPYNKEFRKLIRGNENYVAVV